MTVADDLKKSGYVMLRKGQFWGAFMAVLLATGFTAFSAAKVAVEYSAEAVANHEIKKLRAQSENDAAVIRELAEAARRIVSGMENAFIPEIKTGALTIVDSDRRVLGTFGKGQHGEARLTLLDNMSVKRCEAAMSSTGHYSLMLYSHKAHPVIGLASWKDEEEGRGLRTYKRGAKSDDEVDKTWPQ